jgi:HEAT repeat protein
MLLLWNPLEGAADKEPTYKGQPLSYWLGVLKSKDEKDLIRKFEAYQVLTEIGPEAKAALPALLELLRDKQTGAENSYVLVGLLRLGPTVVPALGDALKDKEERVRQTVAFVLGQMPPADALPALPALEGALKDSSPVVRGWAAEALTNIGLPAQKTVPALKALLTDPDAMPRIAAARALWRLDGRATEATPVLIAALREDKEYQRRTAVAALGEIKPEGKAIVAALRGTLQDKDPLVRREVLGALNRFPGEWPAAAPLIEQTLKDPDVVVRWWAAALLLAHAVEGKEQRSEVVVVLRQAIDQCNKTKPLPSLGLHSSTPGPADVLTKLLQSNDPRLHVEAARSARLVGSEGRTLVPQLLKVFREGKKDVQETIILAFSWIGPDATGAAPALVEVLRSSDAELRRPAALALRRMGADAVPLLIDALTSDTAEVRENAALALGRHAHLAKAPLRKALADPQVHVRVRAAEALGDIPGEEKLAVPVLLDALKHKDSGTREIAAMAMRFVSRESKDAAAALRVALRDEETLVRMAAALSLWTREGKIEELLPIFRQALKDKVISTRRRAVETLADLAINREAGVLPLLLEALDDAEAIIREGAVDALYEATAIAQLGTALANKDSGVRLAAAQALGQIGPDAKGASSQLGEAARDKNPRVRAAARAALRAVRPDNADDVLKLIDQLEEIERMLEEKAKKNREQQNKK